MGGVYLWNFICDCGKSIQVNRHDVHTGHTKSCGCLARETTIQRNIEKTKHGRARTIEYGTWAQMKMRCYNKNDKRYNYYGARGIKVCKRWQKFENFFSDMGCRPSPEHSLDRIDNNGNYEPSNCRWATDIEQNNNTRSNKRILFDGRTKTLSEWAREYRVHSGTLYSRLQRGWPIEKALIATVRKLKRRKHETNQEL